MASSSFFILVSGGSGRGRGSEEKEFYAAGIISLLNFSWKVISQKAPFYARYGSTGGTGLLVKSEW